MEEPKFIINKNIIDKNYMSLIGDTNFTFRDKIINQLEELQMSFVD